MAQGDDVVIAEGPVLDALLESGGVLIRRATTTEHLLAEVSGAALPADTPMAR